MPIEGDHDWISEINPCIRGVIPCWTAPFSLPKRSRQRGHGVSPGAHLASPTGAQGSALYRPDNRTIKSPARHVGPGFLTVTAVYTSSAGKSQTSVLRGHTAAHNATQAIIAFLAIISFFIWINSLQQRHYHSLSEIAI